jgi:hypothetical protein
MIYKFFKRRFNMTKNLKGILIASLLMACDFSQAVVIKIVKDGTPVAILDIKNREVVDVSSDRVEIEKDSKTSHHFGNVIAKIGLGQERLTLKANEMVIMPEENLP